MAARWEKETPKGKKLPKKISAKDDAAEGRKRFGMEAKAKPTRGLGGQRKKAAPTPVGSGQSTGTQEVPALLAEAHGPARRRRKVVKGGAKGPGAD